MMNVRSLRQFAFLLFLLGAIGNAVAYLALAPVWVLLIYLGIILTMMRILDKGGYQERTAVLLVFAVCWFWAGVSEFFTAYVNQSSQGPDSTYFYNVVTDREDSAILPTNAEGVGLLQNAGAIAIWRLAYAFFSSLGFENGRYIGVTLNIAFVALTAMMGVKIVKAIFPDDKARVRRFIVIYAACGMLWLFASIHIRDAMALLCVTFLALFWVNYLAIPSLKNLFALLPVTIISIMLFGLVRSEFTFVPVAMLLAGVAAKLSGNKEPSVKLKNLIVGFLILLPIAGLIIAFMYDEITTLILQREKVYADISALEGGANSLGNQLIVSQSGVVRLVFGSAYLLVFPIPFWSGFLTPSVYHIYKSFHVIFMYMITPLFGLALWRIALHRRFQTTPLLFLAFMVIGFTLAIAYTSLENRHLGAFLVPMMVLAVLPDLDEVRDRKVYRSILVVFLGLIAVLHLTLVTIQLARMAEDLVLELERRV